MRKFLVGIIMVFGLLAVSCNQPEPTEAVTEELEVTTPEGSTATPAETTVEVDSL